MNTGSEASQEQKQHLKTRKKKCAEKMRIPGASVLSLFYFGDTTTER